MTPPTNDAAITSEILKKIRLIELRTSHRVNELLTGSWHSAFKGRGIEFEEVRPYQVGDDVRTIDWNVTARNQNPFVKVFREERELSVMLLVDVSGSVDFGTQHQSKRELITELGATLAMSAIRNQDKVGLTLFSDQIEKHVPARSGSRHVLRLIRELLTCQPIGSRTDLAAAVEHLNRTNKRRNVVFWVSDFFGIADNESTEMSMRVVARKHDVIPVVVQDEREFEMPNVGLVRLQDCETGVTRVIDTSSRRVRKAYQEASRMRANQRDRMFKRLKWNALELSTGEDLAEPLRRYFHARERHQPTRKRGS